MAKEAVFLKVQDKINFCFDNFQIDKTKENVIKFSNVNYKELESEIHRLIRLTKEGKKFENFHSLFIYGPTGVGKSAIVENLATEEGAKFHKLEIQKVPLEEFEGFPYLEDRMGKKVVRLASPTILPPSGDKNVWVLFLDEFNKADTERMAAVMNLVLTGEIGGAADFNEKTGKSEKYKLPEKTIIIGAGNFKTQENVENLNIVNQMDVATSERFHRVMFLDYNAESWVENFAIKEFTMMFNNNKYYLSTRVLPILLHYILEKANENGNKAPFLMPITIKPDEGGSERTTSPRCWTLVSDNMVLDGIEEFDSLPSNSIYHQMSQKMFGDSNKAFNLFMQDPNNQIKFLCNQTMEFGLDGHKIIADIISRFKYFSDNRIIPENIVSDYKKYRDAIKKIKDKKGSILNLLLGVGYYLDRYTEKFDFSNIKMPGINISTFMEDCEIPVEDISAFIHIVSKSKNKSALDMHEFLSSISARYKAAVGDAYYTSEIEVKNGKTASNK